MSQEWHPNPDYHHPYCQFRREGHDCTCVEGREGTHMTARDAWGQVAHNLRALADSIDAAIEPDAARASVPEAGGASAVSPQRSPVPAAPLGVDTSKCPKHGVPWEPGQFGPYCKQMTDDPAWGKAKTDRDGNPVLWCKLTPKNAPDWVRVHGLPS